MGIKTTTDRKKFSQLRQSLRRLANEIRQVGEPFFSDKPVIKGSVYELKTKCGKLGCKCAKGQLIKASASVSFEILRKKSWSQGVSRS